MVNRLSLRLPVKHQTFALMLLLGAVAPIAGHACTVGDNPGVGRWIGFCPPGVREEFRRGSEAFLRQNHPEALRWYVMAATAGAVEAQVTASALYGEVQGNGSFEAVRWMSAAQAQSPQAVELMTVALQSVKANMGSAPPSSGVPQATAGTAGRFTALLDAVVAEDSKSWAMNVYDRGSMRNVTIAQDGNSVRVRGDYTYNGNRTGWVEASFVNERVSCVTYWDYPDQCRRVGQGNRKQLEAEAAEAARQRRAHPSAGSSGSKDNCSLADHLYAPGILGPFAGGMYLGGGCN